MNYLETFGKNYIKFKIRFKHWKTGEELEEVGVMPPQYNNPNSDRYVIVTDTHIMDIIKATVISVEKLDG